MIRNHGDEFAVRRLALDVADRIAEKLLQRVEVAAIPRDLDGVADGPLHAGGGGAELLGHGGVQHLCDGIDDLHVAHGQNDGLPKILEKA